ncbi:sterol carrier protein 2-like [Ostrinia nubilalis]|uniref:sterol carrier protein 2-like n=1 Tax=Ostrinia nubilalis TaxID=29057 RepID=UPI00308242CB
MKNKVYIVGVGVSKFTKPSSTSCLVYSKEAIVDALADARITYEDLEQVFVGYTTSPCSADSCYGQRICYEIGMTAIPIHNVNNNGATGATAIFLAAQLIQGGIIDVALALGFEKMTPGALKSKYTDRSLPGILQAQKMMELTELSNAPVPVQFFANAGIEHMQKYGTTEVHLAKIAAKNYKHAARNPRAISDKEYTVQEILESKKIHGPVTLLQCCRNSDGAGAVVIMSENAVNKYNLLDKAVEIVGMELATDTADVFTDNSLMKVAGYGMTCLAAQRLYQKTGVSPNDIDVVELHDCFAPNELITYEGLQLCKEGEAGKFIDAGDNTYGGKVVVNPSGGLIGKGHPIAASGVAQCAELVWQLRGDAGARQVPNAKIGLQHTLGLGGATVVGLYRKVMKNNTS